MDDFINMLLAVLAIAMPLGVAYAILFFQELKPIGNSQKDLAITHDHQPQGGIGLSHAEEKYGAR